MKLTKPEAKELRARLPKKGKAKLVKS